jgi:hypothetical protein
MHLRHLSRVKELVCREYLAQHQRLITLANKRATCVAVKHLSRVKAVGLAALLN